MNKAIIAGTVVLALLGGCKETGDGKLGTVVEVDGKCRIRVVPRDDHRGSPGKWITLAGGDCGMYDIDDAYPRGEK